MNKTEVKEEFKSTSIPIASFLVCKDIPYEIRTDSSGIVSFVFDNNDGQASKYADQFLRSEDVFISPNKLFSAQHTLRTIINTKKQGR